MILHDSRGFEHGGEEELEVVKNFVTKMCSAANVQDRLHVIWFVLSIHPELDLGPKLKHGRFCIEVSSERTQQRATQGVFSAMTNNSVIPIIVVGTKKDKYWNEKFGESRANFGRDNWQELEDHCDRELVERLDNIKNEVWEVEGGRFDAFIPVSKGTLGLT